MNYLQFETATAAGELAPSLEGLKHHHSPEPPSVLTAVLTAELCSAFRSPLVC